MRPPQAAALNAAAPTVNDLRVSRVMAIQAVRPA
jgi:hypothetical protein